MFARTLLEHLAAGHANRVAGAIGACGMWDHQQPDQPARATSQLDRAASPDMLVIEPAHHLTFTEPPEVQGIAFDPDGVTAYIHVWAKYIDVWDVLLSLMPWIAPAVGWLVTLVLLRVIYRRVKAREVAGQQYCTRCGYELDAEHSGEGRAGSICPECGLDTADHPARKGQRLRRRLVVPIKAMVLTIFLTTAAGTAQVWMPGDLSVWPSARLAEMAEDKGWTRLDPLVKMRDQVRRFNLETGQFGRTVCIRPGQTYFRMTISPDGKHLYLGQAWKTIERIKIASGRVVGRITLPQPAEFAMGAPAVISHERNGKDAMLFFLDRDRKRHALIRWNLKADKYQVVFEEEAWSGKDGSGFAATRILVPVSPATGGVYLSSPTFMESYRRGLNEYRLLDESGNVVRTMERISYSHDSPPEVSLDGQWMFTPVVIGGAIRTDDPSTGESRGLIGSAPDQMSICTLTLAPDNQHLLLSYKDVFVYDVKAEQWIARLRAPANLFAAEPFLSSDARWHAVVSQRRPTAAEAARGLSSAHDLVIWDVSQLNMGTIDSGP